jgi:hypothetical protein
VDIIISIVAPLAVKRDEFHNRFKDQLIELRMHKIYMKRPDDYYPHFDEFTCGRGEADYYGFEGLEMLIENIRSGNPHGKGKKKQPHINQEKSGVP